MEQLSKPEPFLMADHHGEDVILVRDALAECAIKNPLQHVADGHEFIDYLQGHGPYADRKKHPMPQLALIEWDLPRRSGLEILRWLRDQPQHSMLPIMVWTR